MSFHNKRFAGKQTGAAVAAAAVVIYDRREAGAAT